LGHGPGLRGSSPAKIDHFLLFCKLQTCEAISSDGVCSLYLKMGWLCSNGMALLRRTFWAEPCIGKSTNWNVLGVDSFTSLYPCEKSDSWEQFYPVIKKIRQYKMNTLYKLQLIYCYLWLKRHFYFY
jgi:hypothetical protein